MEAKKTRNKPPLAVFLASTMLVFGISFFAADSFGFVPYYIDGTDPSAAVAAASSHDLALSQLPQLGETDGRADAALAAAAKQAADAAKPKQAVYPMHITIASVGINLPVQNPSTINVDALDALLVNGPARYANSATLGQSGNMVIFAHSSHLPIVHNTMFQAFNNVPNVQAGDVVSITGSDGTDYIYRVDSVVKATTTDGTQIPLETSGTKLTLVTCDTLTGKSARFILTASYIGTD